MKRSFQVLSVLAMSGLCTQIALAQCILFVDRTACSKDKEVESYKKCDGAKSCNKKRPARSEEQCVEEAKRECVNARFDVTKSKVVKAKWAGKELMGEFDGGFCSQERDDYNKCDKK